MKKGIFTFAVLLCVCFYLAGCAASEQGTAAGANQSSSGVPDGSGGGSGLSDTLVIAGESPSTINPLLETHGELADIIFSGLMKYDAYGIPVPDLAESYEYDEGSYTYTFYLRKGVLWHDGEPFVADDVVYTYGLLMDDETLLSSITSNYEDIAYVTAVDPYTVSITLSRFNAAMLDYFTVGILPEHLLMGEDINTAPFNQAPVGTGRYKLTFWDTAGGMITLERNTSYYDRVPNIETLVYKTVSDETAKAMLLKSGDADIAWLNASYAEEFREDGAYTCWDFATADYRGVSMDMGTDFWAANADSIGVLNYAIDKQLIVESVLRGRGEAAYSPIQKNPLGSSPDADIYPYDPDAFEAAMESLGWEKGPDGIYIRDSQRFSFSVQVREYEEERVDIANVVSAMLLKAGVEMEVALVTRFDWETGYDGFLYGYAAQFDPDMVYTQFVTGASDNTMGYSDPEVDRLLSEGRHTADTARRQEIYAAFEKAYARSPGIVLIAYLDGNYVGISGLRGLDTRRVLGHHAAGFMWNIEEWTLEK